MRIKNANSVITRKFTPDTKIRFVGNFANTDKVPANETVRNPEISYQKMLRSETLGDSVTNIIFINGMLNTPLMAEENLHRIRLAYEDKLNTEEFPGDYIFTLGYNQTHGMIHDFSEVMFQWSKEFGESGNALEWLAPIIDEEYYEEAMGFSANIRGGSDNRKKFLQRIAEFILKFKIEAVTASHSQTTGELRKITDDSFENKQRVIIISHSQGNLYANELIDYYNQNNKEEEMLRTGVLNIAPPTVSPSKLWWYTNSDDAVINNSRKNFNQNILPGFENYVISDDEDPRERRRHGFWTSYFHDNLRSRLLIDSVFFDYCENLPFEPTYHPDDVAQINNLIVYHGLDWEYDNPKNWNKDYISWTDTTTNKRITRLHMAWPNILSGDVSLDLQTLDSLLIGNSQISSLDISNNTELTHLDVAGNLLTSLDLTNNKKLTNLICWGNYFSEDICP
jgi:hypothetical protein